jgi:hypothetical protein
MQTIAENYRKLNTLRQKAAAKGGRRGENHLLMPVRKSPQRSPLQQNGMVFAVKILKKRVIRCKRIIKTSL